MDTNATEYLRVLNAACRQLSRGTDAGDIEQAVGALRAINPDHVLLPALEAKARQLKMEKVAERQSPDSRQAYHCWKPLTAMAANSLCDD
jgi:hypothetical protein